MIVLWACSTKIYGIIFPIRQVERGSNSVPAREHMSSRVCWEGVWLPRPDGHTVWKEAAGLVTTTEMVNFQWEDACKTEMCCRIGLGEPIIL